MTRIIYMWRTDLAKIDFSFSNTFGTRIPLVLGYLCPNTFGFEYLWAVYRWISGRPNASACQAPKGGSQEWLAASIASSLLPNSPPTARSARSDRRVRNAARTHRGKGCECDRWCRQNSLSVQPTGPSSLRAWLEPSLLA